MNHGIKSAAEQSRAESLRTLLEHIKAFQALRCEIGREISATQDNGHKVFQSDEEFVLIAEINIRLTTERTVFAEMLTNLCGGMPPDNIDPTKIPLLVIAQNAANECPCDLHAAQAKKAKS